MFENQTLRLRSSCAGTLRSLNTRWVTIYAFSLARLQLVCDTLRNKVFYSQRAPRKNINLHAQLAFTGFLRVLKGSTPC